MPRPHPRPHRHCDAPSGHLVPSPSSSPRRVKISTNGLSTSNNSCRLPRRPQQHGEGFGNGRSGPFRNADTPSPTTLVRRTAIGLSPPSARCRLAGSFRGGRRCITHLKGRATNWPGRTGPSVHVGRSPQQRRRSSRSAGTRRPRSPGSSETGVRPRPATARADGFLSATRFCY